MKNAQNDTRQTQPKAQAKPSRARFEDTLDLLAWFDNAAPDEMAAHLATLEEVSDADFAAEVRRRREKWAAMSEEDKQAVRVGEAIFERLILLEMRQAELARRLGKNRAWVSRVVQGRENLTIRTLSRLAAILECEVADLLRPASKGAGQQEFTRLESGPLPRTIAPARPVLRLLRANEFAIERPAATSCFSPSHFKVRDRLTPQSAGKARRGSTPSTTRRTELIAA